ncbi:MAG: M12 family metallo-peptidase [Kiritimatiellia bacterium]
MTCRMVKKLMLSLLCVAGAELCAREIALDLAGESVSSKVARLMTASADSETVREHRLAAGAARVTGLAVGDVIAFKLFEDETLRVTLVEETAALAGRSFLGRIDNALNALGCVVLETSEGIVLDVTDFERNRVWQVVSDANGVSVREIEPKQDDKLCGSDTLRVQPGQRPVNVSVTTENGVVTVVTNEAAVAAAAVTEPADGSVVASSAVTSEVVALSAEQAAVASAVAAGETTVDILVNYDTDAATWAKANGGGLEAFAETCVQKMNAALANTGLNAFFRFRLVGVYEVGGSADGNLEYALYFASGYYTGTLNGVSWAGVAEERERLGADIVCTLCDSGLAYGWVGLGYSLYPSSYAPSYGFNACQIRSVAISHTMTHEVGHNMGAGHSDKMAESSNCGPQYHDYSSGYYFYVGSTGYYTIMAYNADGYGNYYTSVPYFSSPDYFYQGVAVGTADKNDNTRTLRETYQTVAANCTPPYVSSEIGEGLEAEDYVWMTSGRYPWTRVTDSSYDGVDSARSCAISNSGVTSWTETKVAGPATLAFWLRLRTPYGCFNVFTNGVAAYTRGDSSSTSYGTSWEAVSVEVPAGEHTVRLAYTHGRSYFTSGHTGAWVDRLSFSGGSPVREETTTTEVPVPYSWLADYYPGDSTSDYETRAAERGANGYYVWQSYVAGLDPTDPDSLFKAHIAIEDGKPVVTWEPELSAEEAAKRRYTVYGKTSLEAASWSTVPSGDEGLYRFFKVAVEMK